MHTGQRLEPYFSVFFAGFPGFKPKIGLFQEPAMLDLRPNCECCNKDLPPDSLDARICSFECTFCVACADGPLGGKCPNCGGEFVRRPRRPAGKLAKSPASTTRVFQPEGCVGQPARV